jgi:hypothetical protein
LETTDPQQHVGSLLTERSRRSGLQGIVCENLWVQTVEPEDIMSRHAENLHIGASALGTSVANLLIANSARRREERFQAEADANSVASVRRLASMLAAAQNELAASRRREAALTQEVDGLRYDLECAHAALRRVL